MKILKNIIFTELPASLLEGGIFLIIFLKSILTNVDITDIISVTTNVDKKGVIKCQ